MELFLELDTAILADIADKYQGEFAALVSRSTFNSVNPRLYRVFKTPMSAAWSANVPESSVPCAAPSFSIRVMVIPFRLHDQLLSR
jgi:hypothetical protein